MNAKLIDDTELYELFELHYKLQQLLPAKLNHAKSAFNLLKELAYKDAIGSGLYMDNILVGFINGYGTDNGIYYVSNIYVLQEARIGIKKLLCFTEELIKSKGYTIWVANSMVAEGKRMIKKFGGKEI